MIAVDTNVLVHAHREELPLHEPAKERLRALAEGAERWTIPVFCLGEFVRVVTHPRIFENPFTVPEVIEAVNRLIGSPSLRIVMPGDGFTALYFEALRQGDASGNLAFDAQIVAVCREHGIRKLITEDRDFARFDGFPTERIVPAAG